MYAIVRQLKINESFKDENKRRVHDELLPQVQAIPGFVDYYLIYTDKQTEVSFGVFKDKKGADTLNKIASDFVKTVAPKVEIQTVTEGEIVLEARKPAFA